MNKLLRSGRKIGKLAKYALPIACVGVVAWWIQTRPVTVVADQIKRGDIVAETMGTGTLEARVEATVGAKIQGRLMEVLVDQNDVVVADQSIAILDDAELKEQVAVAQATLNATLATVERVRADENRAKAVLNQAQLSHARALDLMKANVAAQADLDKAIELMQVAEADVQRAQAAIVESERQRLTAQASLKYQQTRLADTRILSPFAGLVVRRDRDPGDVVVPGASILQLIATNELWISAWVDETAMEALAPGQSARVVFRSEPARHFAGKVARLGRQTDRETREFIVDVLVEELPVNWAVGQRAEVYIETERKESVLTVPESFVVWREGEAGVFVDVEGKARWRVTTPGLRGDGVVEVTVGLQEGDSVVKPIGAPGVSLKDGKRVRVP